MYFACILQAVKMNTNEYPHKYIPHMFNTDSGGVRPLALLSVSSGTWYC